jgi:copper(I)-binding protein
MNTFAFVAMLAIAGQLAHAADVRIEKAWIRAAADGQPVSGAYFEITAQHNAKLVKVDTTAAEHAELHEMSLQGGIMKMRPLTAIALPAGQKVVLKPNGLHVMLFNPKTPLAAGSKETMVLTIDEDGKRSQLKLSVDVKTSG